MRYQHTFEVTKSGDGLIQVQKPANDDQNPAHQKQLDLHIEPSVIEGLLNAYFADVAPILPVVTEAEFLATSNPPPILVYSMCLVAAARREVPQKVFDSIRYAVNSIIKAEDVLSTASIVNVQALLILCMTGDCHSQFVPNALSALWIRLGTAIRMVHTKKNCIFFGANHLSIGTRLGIAPRRVCKAKHRIKASPLGRLPYL